MESNCCSQCNGQCTKSKLLSTKKKNLAFAPSLFRYIYVYIFRPKIYSVFSAVSRKFIRTGSWMRTSRKVFALFAKTCTRFTVQPVLLLLLAVGCACWYFRHTQHSKHLIRILSCSFCPLCVCVRVSYTDYVSIDLKASFELSICVCVGILSRFVSL